MARPVYGLGPNGLGDCWCVPETPYKDTLLLFKSVLTNLRTAIERFYNSTLGVAPVVANMSMKAFVSTPVFVRMRWIEENPGIRFNKWNPAHRDGIKFIYNLINKDWRTDPMFRAMRDIDAADNVQEE